jgi:hypothetical protein
MCTRATRGIAVGIGVGFDWVAIIIGLGVETGTGAVGLQLACTATSGGVVGSSRKYSRHSYPFGLLRIERG